MIINKLFSCDTFGARCTAQIYIKHIIKVILIKNNIDFLINSKID